MPSYLYVDCGGKEMTKEQRFVDEIYRQYVVEKPKKEMIKFVSKCQKNGISLDALSVKLAIEFNLTEDKRK